MVTNYPQHLTSATRVASGTETDAPGVLVRAAGRVGQLLCGLRGHDAVLHFEGNRIMMRCTSCGHDTPGLEITGRGPRKRFEGDARRHMIIITPQEVTLRKTA